MKLQALLMNEAKERKDGKQVAGMDVNCPTPGKLNLNLPLLSTRRLGGSNYDESYYTLKARNIASNRVPFSWEHAPGKPKKSTTNETDDNNSIDSTPRPRLPPCRWQPEKPVAAITNIGEERNNVDEGLDHNKLEVHSDVVDELSLTEAIDIAQKAESDDDRVPDGLNLESSMESNVHNHTSCRSPNFMIERFLPDATAIAGSSILQNSLPKNSSKNNVMFLSDNMESCPWKKPVVEGSLVCSNSKSPRKGCGLEIFHPWRMKHKLCGVNSPGKEVSSTVQSRKLVQCRKAK